MSYLLSVVLTTLLINSSAAAETIKVAITGTYAPYHYLDENEKPLGIHYDILSKIAKNHGHEVKFIKVPRKRMEIRTAEGVDDAFLNALEWTAQIERFVFTDPLSLIEDVVFTTEKKPLNFASLDDLAGKLLITIRGYHYPPLDPYFKSKKIARIDTQDELAALKMLDEGRGDGAVVVARVGKWIIKNNALKNKMVQSPKEITRSEFRVVFNKKWQPFIEKFNKDLQAMKSDGSFDKIIEKYSE